MGMSLSAVSQELPYQLQRDTTELEERELEVDPPDYLTPLEREKYYTHSPRRASLYSAVLPGLGQAYNGRFWKIPIIYAGTGVLVYSINWNHTRYIDLKSALFTYLNKEGTTGSVYIPSIGGSRPEDNVRRTIDRYRRDRDYLIIISGLVYLLNIADAMVDAHLQSFELGDDLSMKVAPAGVLLENNTRFAGISLTLKF